MGGPGRRVLTIRWRSARRRRLISTALRRSSLRRVPPRPPIEDTGRGWSNRRLRLLRHSRDDRSFHAAIGTVVAGVVVGEVVVIGGIGSART